MRRLLAVAVVIAALAAGASSAGAAPPDFGPAQRLCELHGGFFSAPVTGEHYRCRFQHTGTRELSENEVRAARGLCEGAYKGVLFYASHDYSCMIAAQ